MELARRAITGGGVSVLDMYLENGRLFLRETDTGSAPDAVFGGGGVEYYLSIRGEERLVKMLQLLGTELERDLVVLLDDDGLRRLADALLERFGDGLELLKDFRAWLAVSGVEFRTQVV